MARAVKIYLDQSAYGQFLNQAPKDWKQAEVAQILVREQAAKRAEVWASPTNVLETLQASTRRGELAAIILSLTEAKRMWAGSDFERVRDFLGFFDVIAPGFWRHKEFFKHHFTTSRRIWIGALALLACPEELDLSAVVDTATRNKSISRLLHARFAEDPDRFIKHVKETVESLIVTTGDPFEETNKLTLPEIESEIAKAELGFTKFSKDAHRLLNTNRRAWSQAFGAMEIGRILQSIFFLPMELVFMIDVRPVVKKWDTIRSLLKWDRALPKEVALAEDVTLISDMTVIQVVLQELVYAATKAPLITSYIGYEVVFRELQRCLNHQKIPTGGLSFDADHSVAMVCFDIVISNDKILVDSLKTLGNQIETQTKGRLAPSVVTTGTELEKALSVQAARGVGPGDVETY